MKYLFLAVIIAVCPLFANAAEYYVSDSAKRARAYCEAHEAIYGIMSGTGMVQCVTETQYDDMMLHSEMSTGDAIRIVRAYCIANMANPDNCVEIIKNIIAKPIIE